MPMNQVHLIFGLFYGEKIIPELLFFEAPVTDARQFVLSRILKMPRKAKIMASLEFIISFEGIAISHVV